MIEKAGYERFGLVRNPFQDLASETLDEADLVHVDQQVDKTLNELKQDVFEQKRKALVAIVGPLGVGKTQRLRVTEAEAKRVGALAVHDQMTVETRFLVKALAESIREAADLGTLTKLVNTPKWYRELQALERRVKKDFDPNEAGELLARALNANRPAFVMLNDLQNLTGVQEADRFFQTIYALSNHLKPGVMVMFSSYPTYFNALRQRHAALTARLDRILELHGLNHAEAERLIAKRLPAHRIIDDLDPLYPFTSESVAALARLAGNNPRRLLKVADLALEVAVRTRVNRVDEATVAHVAQDPTVQRWHVKTTRPRTMTPAQ